VLAGAALLPGSRAVSPGAGAAQFQSGIDLVALTATVVDQNGHLASGLTRDDFVVLEGGEPQPIAEFAAGRVPVSLGIVVDLSGSMNGPRLEGARASLRRFVAERLRAGDETLTVTFDHRPRVLGAWLPQPKGLPRLPAKVEPTAGAALYDAVVEAVSALERATHPKHALLLVTDGTDNASEATLTDIITLLRRTQVIVYALGIDTPVLGFRDERVDFTLLRQLADESGGTAELVRDTFDLSEPMERIGAELDHQYLIAYAPTLPPDASYRSISVRVVKQGYRARARQGYARGN
jgi:Ca-activated chloride channel family protein